MMAKHLSSSPAQTGHPEVVVELLAWGAAVDAEGRYGRTPLLIATAKGRYNVVELLTNGALPDEVA